MASVDFSRESLTTLNRDGISEEVYKILWARDEMNFSPGINIPDTIIFKYGQPVSWYFTAMNGQIKKKHKQHLISAKIEEAFNKNILGYDIIAYFITMTMDDPSAEPSNKIQYLDREALAGFLYDHKKEVSGILQRFIEPKGTHNEIIRAIWSPKLCLLERAENIHALHDNRYGLYERCVVYDGPDYYYTSAPLRGPVLSGQIQKLCEAAIAHVSEVTYGQKSITRMVFNYKVDSRDKIWFLYSTSIRCTDTLEAHTTYINPTLSSTNNPGEEPPAPIVRNLVNIDAVVTIPDSIPLNPFKTYEKIPPRTKTVCLSCSRETLDEVRHPITYKSIMKHYDHVLYLLKSSISLKHQNKKDGTIAWPPDPEMIEAAGGVGFACLYMENGEIDKAKFVRQTKKMLYKPIKDIQIPPLIIALHPKLNPDTYIQCKADPLFYNKTMYVCENCYLVYAEFATMLLQMGNNLHKLLTPDNIGTRRMMATTSNSTLKNRPSSADWRAISTISQQNSMTSPNRSMSAGESGYVNFQSTLSSQAYNHILEAKERAIGIRSNEIRPQPIVPMSIRTAQDSSILFSSTSQQLPQESIDTIHNMMMDSAGKATASSWGRTSSLSPFKGGMLEHDSLSQSFAYNPEDVQDMIAQRERKFFKEISLNPQLKEQHPLMHLISTQQKLALIDQQSGVLMSKQAKQSEGLFDNKKYGKQSTDEHHKYSTYRTELPYTINGEIVLPSVLKHRKLKKIQLKRANSQQSLRSFLAGDSSGMMHDTAGNIPQILKNIQSAPAFATTSATAAGIPQANTATTGTRKMKVSQSSEALDANVKSSKRYREYLSESLKRIQEDLVEAKETYPNANNSIAMESLAQSTPPRSRSSPQRVSRASTVAATSATPATSNTTINSNITDSQEAKPVTTKTIRKTSVTPSSAAHKDKEKEKEKEKEVKIEQVYPKASEESIPPKSITTTTSGSDSSSTNKKEGANATVKTTAAAGKHNPPHRSQNIGNNSTDDSTAPNIINSTSVSPARTRVSTVTTTSTPNKSKESKPTATPAVTNAAKTTPSKTTKPTNKTTKTNNSKNNDKSNSNEVTPQSSAMDATVVDDSNSNSNSNDIQKSEVSEEVSQEVTLSQVTIEGSNVTANEEDKSVHEIESNTIISPEISVETEAIVPSETPIVNINHNSDHQDDTTIVTEQQPVPTENRIATESKIEEEKEEAVVITEAIPPQPTIDPIIITDPSNKIVMPTDNESGGEQISATEQLETLRKSLPNIDSLRQDLFQDHDDLHDELSQHAHEEEENYEDAFEDHVSSAGNSVPGNTTTTAGNDVANVSNKEHTQYNDDVNKAEEGIAGIAMMDEDADNSNMAAVGGSLPGSARSNEHYEERFEED